MYYVTMTDKFMSGWGRANGRTNKLVISCANMREAVIVEANARRRPEMVYVNIRATKPSYPKRYYYTSWHGREQGDYENWFTPDYF